MSEDGSEWRPEIAAFTGSRVCGLPQRRSGHTPMHAFMLQGPLGYGKRSVRGYHESQYKNYK
jgi:hypothetical protein